jgi:hypothetical protein
VVLVFRKVLTLGMIALEVESSEAIDNFRMKVQDGGEIAEE